MSELRQTLLEIDALIAWQQPKFFRKLRPAAKDGELESIRAAMGVAELPADVREWFSWHAGGPDGIFPWTSWGIIHVQEAVDALRSRNVGRDLPALWCPLTTGRDGGFQLYVPGARAEIHEYYDSARVRVDPFGAWITRLHDAWRAEREVVRVPFVRIGRSIMGWQQAELPASARKKIVAALKEVAAKGGRMRFSAGGATLAVVVADAAEWRARDGGSVDLALPAADVAALAAALAKEDSAEIPGVADAKISLSEM